MPVPPHRAFLRQLRLERSLTQKQAAELIGVSHYTLNRIEQGGSGSVLTRKVIADFYGVHVRDVFPELFRAETVAC